MQVPRDWLHIWYFTLLIHKMCDKLIGDFIACELCLCDKSPIIPWVWTVVTEGKVFCGKSIPEVFDVESKICRLSVSQQ